MDFIQYIAIIISAISLLLSIRSTILVCKYRIKPFDFIISKTAIMEFSNTYYYSFVLRIHNYSDKTSTLVMHDISTIRNLCNLIFDKSYLERVFSQRYSHTEEDEVIINNVLRSNFEVFPSPPNLHDYYPSAISLEPNKWAIIGIVINRNIKKIKSKIILRYRLDNTLVSNKIPFKVDMIIDYNKLYKNPV